MHFLAVSDFTKLGTFSQQNINAHAQWMANVLAKNPLSDLDYEMILIVNYDSDCEFGKSDCGL